LFHGDQLTKQFKAKPVKRLFILLILFLWFISILVGQKSSIELTFTAIDSTKNVQLDSIRIINRTQGGDTILYWPDTVLILWYTVGIVENNHEKDTFEVSQNYPNPFSDNTSISITVPEEGLVSIILTDVLGHPFIKEIRILNKGRHTFRLYQGGGQLYFLNAQWRDVSSTIKIVQTSSSLFKITSLKYMGREELDIKVKSSRAIKSFNFSLGDELLYIGYVDTLQSGLLDSPEASHTNTFQFATNLSCVGMPTVEYEGQLYNTIQVFSQCWLKENLNVGEMIPGSQDMSDNGLLEKYCYNNNQVNCDIYGGLYQWDEMMLYTNLEGSQGICPNGWHIPSDEEWKLLEGAVDSHYGIGDPHWDLSIQNRGFDAGLNLKSNYGWQSGGDGLDLYGMTILPSGARGIMGFGTLGFNHSTWTSSEVIAYQEVLVWYRMFGFSWDNIYRTYMGKEMGYSVRCLKN
jgi:uncharacterized protein (TIGR02145 family)